MDDRQGALENLVIDRSFWRGRKVLVTGHTGFKGSWICLWLQRLGADITGYSLQPPTIPSLFEVARVGGGMNHVVGDVRDLSNLVRVMSACRPDVVLHMAAQSLVRASYKDPLTTYSTNVMGTVNLLEAARQQESVRVILNVTSDKCYENHEWIWGYRENEAMGGKDPYSSSKACSELVTAAYRHSFFDASEGSSAAVASARAGNVIGGGDWALDRLVPDFFRAMEAGKTLVVRNPDSVRPWQHVLEPLCGYLMLLQALWSAPQEFSGAWNFGPSGEDDWSVHKLIDQLAEILRPGVRWRVDSESNSPEAHYLRLDSSKARSILRWKPRLSLKSALALVADWHAAYMDRADMRAMSEKQLAGYESLLSTANRS